MIAGRAIVILAALAATSCGARLMTLPTAPGIPAPDIAPLLNQATAACRGVSTISAELAVRGSVRGERLRGRLLVGVTDPDSMYIEAPAPFGAPVFILGVIRGDATLLLPRDRRVVEHAAPDDVLEAIAGVRLTASELRATLTGCPAAPVPADADARQIGDDWRVIRDDTTIYLRRAATGRWRLVSATRRDGDGFRTDFAQFEADLPRRIRIVSNESRGYDLQLELSQVAINERLDPATFRVVVPDGTRPISLDELRAGGPLAR